MLRTVGAGPILILDISRLISRAGAHAATGIDRVELAYAAYLLTYEHERTYFCAMHPLGFVGLLPSEAVKHFIGALSARWSNNGGRAALIWAKYLQYLLMKRLKTSLSRLRDHAYGAIYLLVSHHHLTRPRVIERALKRWRADFVVMIHDLIPLEFPEYSRPLEAARHARRIETVSRLAHGVIVPADVVGNSLRSYLPSLGRHDIPVWTIRHGVPAYEKMSDEESVSSSMPESGRPYFVCLGTIEPRKNHLLLLNLWRKIAARTETVVPRLILVGKRGWENENIIDMLERCPDLVGNVEEMSALSDQEVVALLRGAKGLLFPTFAEGFGLPLAEALTLGVPTISSDIPVLREVGGEIPLYLDPLDGPAWLDAIDDFCAGGPLYNAQKAALGCVHFWGWTESVEASIRQIDRSSIGNQNRVSVKA